MQQVMWIGSRFGAGKFGSEQQAERRNGGGDSAEEQAAPLHAAGSSLTWTNDPD
jgi:hypothetical protein